jgi:hypothetical protein
MPSLNRIFTLAAALTLGAGFHANAVAADKTAIPPAQPGHAQVVFMRSSTVNMLVATDIYDVTSGEPKVIGDMSNNRKVVLDLAPGEYTFMVGNVPWLDFLQASVLADKQYFVIVAPHWPANFSPRAIKRQGQGDFVYSSPEFAKLLKKTRLASPPETMKPEKLEKVAMFYKEQWEKWQAKTPEQKAELTIRQEDWREP